MHCHRVWTHLWHLLGDLCVNASFRLVDSTIKLHRVDRHRVAKDFAAFGYNHQGAHYGFKLHLSADSVGGRTE